MKKYTWLIIVVFFAISFTACNTPAPPPTAVPPDPSPIPQATATPAAEPTPSEADILDQVSDEPIGDQEALTLMYDLIATDPQLVTTAVMRIVRAQDDRFNAVFIEMIRASQIGIVPAPADMFVIAAEQLSGQEFGNNWAEWTNWYGATAFQPPDGFTTWKGVIYSEIDARFGDFLSDNQPSNLRPEEIQWGGVRSDGIPALDQPAMLTAVEATYLNGGDAVFGLHINGESRAYPLRIMDWHEMANDTIGGVPVSIAYCTLCGAAVAFDGRASDGNQYDFGSSGFLYRSNKLMFDRQTGTLWNQLTGDPVLGELVGQEVALDVLPIVLTTWADWRTAHPQTLVLDVETGFQRTYAPGAAYADYFASELTMFPVWQRSDLLPDKSQIYAVRVGGLPKAFPLSALTAEQVVNDSVGETNVVLFAPRQTVEITGESQRTGIERSYSPGTAVRAYERGALTFSLNESGQIIDQDGRVWQATERALIGPAGEELARVGGHLAYWFGWFAFFPNTAVYGQ